MLKIRSGIGYDFHRLRKGSGGLFLGGIKVSDELEFVAHSDGDLLIHALIDSLLGAAGEKDIGELFPDTDIRYKNIKSTVLLRETLKILEKKNLEIINIDAVIIAEIPKISPFKEQVKANMAAILGIDAGDFNVKAKTKEKTGAVGRGEAMECYCVSMIRSKS
jgi:2-C-methyl-D-erythritol 2,4-cyclodiphosphate synthase